MKAPINGVLCCGLTAAHLLLVRLSRVQHMTDDHQELPDDSHLYFLSAAATADPLIEGSQTRRCFDGSEYGLDENPTQPGRAFMRDATQPNASA